jgi:hypothetical protein
MKNIFKKPVIKLATFYKTEKREIRLIIRNHWSYHFSGHSFIFLLDKKIQGIDCKTYRLGLFNLCLVLLDSNEKL